MKTYEEMADNVLKRRDQHLITRKRQRKQLTAGLSCLCLCILVAAAGHRTAPAYEAPLTPADDKQTAVTPPVKCPEEPASPQTAAPESSSQLEDPVSPIPEERPGEPILSADVTEKTPLSPAEPLTLQELYERAGDYLPQQGPTGYGFTSANAYDDSYSVIWSKGLDDLNWRVRDFTDQDALRLTAVADTVHYDMALYPIPLCDSVPPELREMVYDPVFEAGELTLAAVEARAYQVNDAGDSDGCRMHFSVRCGDKLISITSKGVSPGWLYEQLSRLPAPEDAPAVPVPDDTGALTPYEAIWGGSYLDDHGRWFIWLTEDSEANRAEVFRRNPDLSEKTTSFRKADYSLADLTQLLDTISAAMVNQALSQVSSAALREDLNRVEVCLMTDDPAWGEQVLAFDDLGGAILLQYGIGAQVEVPESKE